MTRSWWLRAALFGLLTAASLVVLAPTVLSREDLPAFLAKHARTMRSAVDVRGGLRFVYEADVEKALSWRLERLAPGLEQYLRQRLDLPSVTVVPGPNNTLVLTTGSPVSDRRPLLAAIDEFGMVLRSQDSGSVTVAFTDRQASEVVESSLRSTLERLRGRAETCDPPLIEREGNSFVIELPGNTTSDAARIRSAIERL